MKITFYGAAGGVTGSCSLLEAEGQRFLVDCGMFQGDEELEKKNLDPLLFDPTTLTAVFVTHAHLDHVGRLPLLMKGGFTGHFYATPPTVELAELIMEDALGVMTYDHKKMGKPIIYDEMHIAGVMEAFKAVEYDTPLAVGGMTVTFRDAGHIFGSAFIEFEAEGKRVVFSGDVGNVKVPILRDTEALPAKLDALICESTYGDRLHESSATRQEFIERLVSEAIGRGGVVMIPSFSLERTQELIYDLNDLIERKHKLAHVPIFLDSPLAIDALKVYRKYSRYYDEEATRYFKEGDDMFTFPGLTPTYTRDESMKINHTPGPKIIIAGAGMMNGGRIVHHALRYLSDAHNTLLLIGYQSKGTLGRRIMDGQSPVRILGENVPVHCQVKMIGALSAHGDQNKLLGWIGTAKPRRVFLNHGDPAAKVALAKKLGELGIKSTPVEPGMKVEI
ncbi:MAG: MBL fold metallo-hydrolase [Candidatus Magasanikbacteria bacterium]|nr:MBL fold metallo-hydrolase [Candidatus Magasanikbacteria bacterium]